MWEPSPSILRGVICDPSKYGVALPVAGDCAREVGRRCARACADTSAHAKTHAKDEPMRDLHTCMPSRRLWPTHFIQDITEKQHARTRARAPIDHTDVHGKKQSVTPMLNLPRIWPNLYGAKIVELWAGAKGPFINKRPAREPSL